MKLKSIIVLLALGLSLALPPSLTLMTTHGGQTAIVTLDVCHAGTPALSTYGKMPCVNECMCRPLPLAQPELLKIANSPLLPFFFAFQDERPPKA